MNFPYDHGIPVSAVTLTAEENESQEIRYRFLDWDFRWVISLKLICGAGVSCLKMFQEYFNGWNLFMFRLLVPNIKNFS